MFDLTQFIEIANKLGELVKKHEETNAKHEEMHSAHETEFGGLMAAAQVELERARAIQKGDQGDMPAIDEVVAALLPHVVKQLPPPEKGDPGDPGDEGIAPTLEEVVAALLPRIKVPKPKAVDTDAIKRAVLASLPFFTADPKAPELDLDKLVEAVHEKMGQKGHPGLDTAMDSYLRKFGYKPYVHGGGDTVKAGTNVTVTRNPDGSTTISASGGSGFTELTATETPNGSTTVFTFAAATAQPSYIVSDNVWMKATSKAGSVNWTWNAGAKKATMAVPPADDMFAIV